MRHLKKLDQLNHKGQNNSKLQKKTLQFISIGIGCNCLVSLNATGALNILLNTPFLTEQDISNLPNPIPIRMALLTLEKCRVVKKRGTNFQITALGRSLADQIGLINMLFDGYADLIAHQNQISNKEINNPAYFIRGSSISKAAVELAKNTFDPILMNEFSNLKISGLICDLGCGYGKMLSQICQQTGNPGLGFDNEQHVVHEAQKIFQETNISIQHKDIMNIQGLWEDVSALIQCHVLHDVRPDECCINIINSYLNNFPKLKYFFYLDTVSPSHSHNSILPGFDYVHGLLGLVPRTYEETINMFSQSHYNVFKEIAIPLLPNTFLWILTPKNQRIKDGSQKRLK